MVFEQNLTEFDAAMQVWSNKDPEIAKLVRKVVDTRLAFTRKALKELGFAGDDLEMRTRAFIAFISSERQIYGPSKKISERYRERTLAMLLGE